MLLLSAWNDFYIILSSYVEGYVKKISRLNFMPLVGFQASKIWKFLLKVYSEASLQIIFRKNFFPRTPFDFRTVFHMVWKNQESCESWLVGFWVSWHSKMQKRFANSFSFAFLSCYYGFSNYFEILIFVFSNIMRIWVSTSTSRNIKL